MNEPLLKTTPHAIDRMTDTERALLLAWYRAQGVLELEQGLHALPAVAYHALHAAPVAMLDTARAWYTHTRPADYADPLSRAARTWEAVNPELDY